MHDHEEDGQKTKDNNIDEIVEREVQKGKGQEEEKKEVGLCGGHN